MKLLGLGKSEIFLVGIILIHILIGITLYFTDLELFLGYVREDHYIENLTSVILFAASFHFLWKAIKAKNKLLKVASFFLFLLFLFGGGEEISYGQRIFGYETPDDFARINGQGEVTIHNLNINGVDVNRLVFSTILYVSAFIYFIGFPLIYKKSKKIRSWKYFLLPVPKLIHGILFTLFFLLILVTESDIKGCWEIEEFNLVAFLYLTFLFQQNKRFMTNTPPTNGTDVATEAHLPSSEVSKRSHGIEA